MPMNTREMLLIIRASDQASRVVAGVGRSFSTLTQGEQEALAAITRHGQSMMMVGAGITAIGVAASAFYVSAIKDAVEFDKQARLTLSQVDQVGVSLKDIKGIAIEVASAIPAPFDQMQAALYDIFSSMDVGVEDAKTLLTAFSKAAVAGNVDVQTAGRATIAIMNAFKVPFTDVNRIMDIQFQLVRKGVGTYEEFASTIGRAIPSAVRAGQSIETLAGMLAYLTRNGLSAAMASATAGRALDAMSKPIVADRLNAIGIAVRDASGEFRPLVDVVREMNEHFGKMTAPDRAAALEALFKGAGGTIQARRFFDTVFKNFDEFEQRVGEMGNATGQLGKAFDRAASGSAAQWQLLSNNFKILKVTIGEVLLPVVNAFAKVLIKFLQTLNNLPGPVKVILTIFGALAAVLTVVMGIVTMAAGAYLVLGAALVPLHMTVGALTLAIGGWLVVLLALVAVGYLIVRNWDTIKNAAMIVWDFVKQKVLEAWYAIQPFFDWVQNTFGPGLAEVWNKIKENTAQLAEAFKETWNALWSWFAPFIEAGWTYVSALFTTAFDIIKAIVTGALDYVKLLWQTFGDNVLVIIQILWAAITGVIMGALDIITGIIRTVLAVIRGDWGAAWEGIKQVFQGIWDTIGSILGAALGVMGEVITSFVTDLPGFFGDVTNILYDIGRKIVQGLINGVKSMFGAVKDVMSEIGDKLIPGSKGPPAHDLKILYNAGQLIMQGLQNGVTSRVNDLKRMLRDVQDLFMINYGPSESVIRAAAGKVVDGAMPTGVGERVSQAVGNVITIAEGAIHTVISATNNIEEVKAVLDERDRALIRAIRQATNGAG